MSISGISFPKIASTLATAKDVIVTPTAQKTASVACAILKTAAPIAAFVCTVLSVTMLPMPINLLAGAVALGVLLYTADGSSAPYVKEKKEEKEDPAIEQQRRKEQSIKDKEELAIPGAVHAPIGTRV